MGAADNNIVVGSHVWVGDAELVWIDGQVVQINGDNAEIQTSKAQKVVAKLSKLYPKDMDSPESGVDDMTKLAYLHEPGVLHNLATRYQMNEIYTYTGNILIAINPFQHLQHLYDDDTMKRYKGLSFGQSSPHVFAIADAAYRAMINEGKSNSILVSGESGAGKTETTKMLMRYLAFVGGNRGGEGRTVEQQVLESNPVLEAFGNAKTVRNNNSSRFGKFVEIQFDKTGKISGAAIRTYLLEKSRVCQISDTERNYHCFYLLCAAPSEERERYKLGNPKSFHYLNQSNCYKLDGVDDAKEYITTKRAMEIVGINQHEQDSIFRVVAAILHLGNISFAKGEESDASVLEDDQSKFHLKVTAELLMCDSSKLEDALCNRLIVTPEEIIKRSLDPHAAATSRDGLAKIIYSRLFDWLVNKVNISIGQDKSSNYLIGVLDIYGFESFKTNSFEQFCINFTNEKLQQHFNQHVFKFEQEEYTREGINWSYLEFVDNQDVLDLIEKKPGGIISLLDEACMFPKSTPETFTEKLYQTFSNHKRFIKPKLARSEFTIVHYAGDVKYQSDQFLEKNKDYIVVEHQDLLSTSTCSFLSGLFPPVSEETSKPSKFSSIGSRFKLQLQQLMETLHSTEPHYIRCVKPNSILKPVALENMNIITQLRSGGVLEAVRIKCAGFPTHRTFPEFLNRFRLLTPDVLRENFDEKDACKMILEKIDLTDYQIGKTQVFLRAGQMAELDARITSLLNNSAVVIQNRFRTRIAEKNYNRLKEACICIQLICRGQLARKLCEKTKKEAASVQIQKNVRCHLARKSYKQLQSSVLVVQTGLRAMAARDALIITKRTSISIPVQDSVESLELGRSTMEEPYSPTNEEPSSPTKEEPSSPTKEEPTSLAKEEPTSLAKEEPASLSKEEHSGLCMEETSSLTDFEVSEAMRENRNPTIEEPISPGKDGEKVRTLAAEVKSLKARLQTEKQRADACERKYTEARQSNEEIQKKLGETERRVLQLQDSLNRMICSMSSQVSELKMILSTSSRLSSTFRPIARVDINSSNSDTSSTDSDFTFPATVSTSANNCPSNTTNSFQLVVQDGAALDVSGSESEKEGSFDDVF